LNWDFYTVPQAAADNIKCEWPRGKVLGGSSAINGLYMNKPGEIEINAWKDLLTGMDGADNWGWEAFDAAMKKSETFTPPSDAIAQEGDITWNAASHGTDGPIHWSYPGYTFPYIGQWSDACTAAGLPASQDTYGGENWGAYVSTSCINPTNWTRSYSRSGYLDPLPPRSNYDVLANAHVTRILFDDSSPVGNLSADAVEYTPDNGATKKTIKVKKEVILAGGTVGSPTVLLHSGIGPKDVLSAAGVPLVFDLPGVGEHLQDHVSVSLQWNANDPTAGTIYEDHDPLANNAAYLSYVNSAVAYAGSDILFGGQTGSMQGTIMSQIDQYAPDSSSDPSVMAGYQATYSATANTIFPSKLGLVELLAGNNVNGAIRIGAALQHPFSHGSIKIASSNPMEYPLIDPSYLKHPADVQILREGLKLTRKIGQSQPLSSSLNKEVFPGGDVQSDDDWDKWLRGQVFTEFHPSSTCSMLPFEQGGVVDANLLVYGLANVRVADASVPPISFSAHLMGSTYGIAEQASHIIRQSHNIQAATKNHTSTDDSHHPKPSQTYNHPASSTETDTVTIKNGACAAGPWPVLLSGMLAFGLALVV
jgi:choline dehydrogenase